MVDGDVVGPDDETEAGNALLAAAADAGRGRDTTCGRMADDERARMPRETRWSLLQRAQRKREFFLKFFFS